MYGAVAAVELIELCDGQQPRPFGEQRRMRAAQRVDELVGALLPRLGRAQPTFALRLRRTPKSRRLSRPPVQLLCGQVGAGR